MSDSAVFCPKCGTPSADGARFCRKCGTNLEAVSRALTGSLPAADMSALADEMEIEYAKEYSKAIYNLLGSVTTFLVLLLIFRGQWWVYFLLLWVANAVRDVVQASLLKRQITNPVAFRAALEAYKEGDRKKKKKRRKGEAEALPAPPAPVSAVPPYSGDYVPPARTTGELEKPRELAFDPLDPPPSVTEGTTRLLEESEGESESDAATRGERASARER